MAKIKPSDLTYDAKSRKAESGSGNVVAVFLTTNDDNHEASDNLGRHNVDKLPAILGYEISENEFEVSGIDLEGVKNAMKAAGFVFKKNNYW